MIKKLSLISCLGLLAGCATKQAILQLPPPPAPVAALVVGGYTLSPTSATAPASGTIGQIGLSTPTWTTSSSDPSWLRVSPASGTGNANLNWIADPNTGAARTGTLTIADQLFTVSQAGGTVPPTTNTWLKSYGGISTDYGSVVAIGPDGNSVVAGVFSGTVNFEDTQFTSAGSYDIFLAKFTPSGAMLWVKHFGASGTESPTAISIDPSGNIYLGGSFYATANFGGPNITSAGDADAFVSKYNSAGTWLWSQTWGGLYTDGVKGVAADTQGNAIVTGSYQGHVMIGQIPLDSSFLSVDAYAAKFSSAGLPLWANGFLNLGSSDYGTAVVVDKRNDNIFLTGYGGAGLNLGGTNLTGGAYLGKFLASGQHIWSKSIGYANPPRAFGVGVDSAGDVAVTGDFHTKTDLGGGQLNGTASGVDFFVAKYSGTDGSHQWSRAITGTTGGDPTSLVVDSANNILLAGFFQGTYNFGNASLNSTAGSADGFMAKYMSAGAPVWAQRIGGAAGDSSYSIAAEQSGNSVVTGYFSATVVFQGKTITSNGGLDIFVTRLLP